MHRPHPAAAALAAKLAGRSGHAVDVLVEPTSDEFRDAASGDIVLAQTARRDRFPDAAFVGLLRDRPFGPAAGAFLAVDGRLVRPRREPPPADFRVTAIVPAFNEEDIIASTIEYLAVDGIDVYVLENWSTDRTEEIAKSYLGRGVVEVERFPSGGATGTFDLTDLLTRTQAIAHEIGGWCLQHDADERRESPWGPAVGLRAALWHVEQHGYNAIDHTQIDFHPTDAGFSPGGDPRTYFRWFEPPIVARDLGHTQAWRQGAEPVDLVSTGGHEVRFPDRRVFPYNFLLRHYGIRSQAHGEKKILRERHGRWNEAERRKGWHFGYDHVRRGHRFVRDPRSLVELTPDFAEAYIVERLGGETVVASLRPRWKRATVEWLRTAGILDRVLALQRRYRAFRRRDVASGARRSG